MHEYEHSIIDNTSSVFVLSQQTVYTVAKDRFSNRENDNIYFIANLFDEVEEPVYIDWIHVGPDGNERIAKEMFRHLKRTL